MWAILWDNDPNAHADADEDLGRKHGSDGGWVVPLLRGRGNAATSLATIAHLPKDCRIDRGLKFGN